MRSTARIPGNMKQLSPCIRIVSGIPPGRDSHDWESFLYFTYSVTLKNEASTKRMIDDLRIRNGNLEISLCDQQTMPSEL